MRLECELYPELFPRHARLARFVEANCPLSRAGRRLGVTRLLEDALLHYMAASEGGTPQTAPHIPLTVAPGERVQESHVGVEPASGVPHEAIAGIKF